MTNPSDPTPSAAETIARIIDPMAWEVFDSSPDEYAVVVEQSLQQADAIIALNVGGRAAADAEAMLDKIAFEICESLCDNLNAGVNETRELAARVVTSDRVKSAILALDVGAAANEIHSSDGKAGSPVQSPGDNPDPAPSCLEQGLATPDTTGKASATMQGEVALVGNVAKSEVDPNRMPRVDHLPCPSEPLPQSGDGGNK